MLASYFKIAWRNLLKGRIYSFINIGGLAVGMAVAILIALWVFDELNYDKYHANYGRLAQVMQHQSFNGKIGTQEANPAQMAEEIRNVFGSDFTYVLQASWNFGHTLTLDDKMLIHQGSFFEPEVVDMLSLKMLYGNKEGLKDMNSILLSQSVAKAYFGNEDPTGKSLRVDDRADLTVKGVYEDIPQNSSFAQLKIIMPWALYLAQNDWITKMENPWGSNYSRTFAMVSEKGNMDQISAKIKDVKLNKVGDHERRYHPIVFLQPMSKWHLYSDFDNGVNTGGRISNVWLFETIGAFVLVLACINFMNLSTARSEKRAKEVGIRKSIGSVRRQLIVQFFSESALIASFAFLFSLLLVLLVLPSFNTVADKQISLPWQNPMFWILGVGFTLATGLLAGCYPALFLSSFEPVQTLKGTFRAGRYASMPRKVLVVLQFMISTILIIGTTIVYQQIGYAQNRPIGYNKDGLVSINSSKQIHDHFDAVRTELVNEGAIVEMAESGSPTTAVYNSNGGFDWEGKDPNLGVDFPNNAVSHDFGKTIKWEIKEGRDFSRDFTSDTAAFILNESAVAFIGLKDPIGKVIQWENKPYTIIGVVKDLLVESPYSPVRASMFHLSTEEQNVFLLKLSPEANVQDAVAKIESVFKRLNPGSPPTITFTDEQYANKFGNEKRLGTLSGFFAILAILSSCLGLFAL
ncbi:MAG: ABC transporter permease, partial [Chryseolinea sp.]